MTLSAQIDEACKSLERYFRLLFDVLGQSKIEDQSAPLEVHDVESNESQSSYHPISHFIKPDMLINLYSLVEFYMKKICDYHQRGKNLTLSHADIQGENDFHRYHKYLTRYADLDLSTVQASYSSLQNLRKVRKHLVHDGGHVPDDAKLQKAFSTINGVALSGSLIVFDDSFVWETLEHAKTYLVTAAQA